MYRLWLHGLCGLYGPRCPLSPKRPINLISLFNGVIDIVAIEIISIVIAVAVAVVIIIIIFNRTIIITIIITTIIIILTIIINAIVKLVFTEMRFDFIPRIIWSNWPRKYQEAWFNRQHYLNTGSPWTRRAKFCRRHFDAFYCNKTFGNLFKFHWSLLLWIQLTIS